MQANWIGRSEGVRDLLPVRARHACRLMATDGALKVFTTRADTLMGVTFMAVAAEHPLALRGRASATRRWRRSSTSAGAAASWKPTSRRRRRRACAPACTCCIRSPASTIEVWVANYVLMGYGEGAVMGVPAHDERDFEFAQKIRAADRARSCARRPAPTTTYVRPGWRRTREYGVTINSGEFDGLEFQAAVDAIAAALEQQGLGRKRVQ